MEENTDSSINTFYGVKQGLTVFNKQAILNLVFEFDYCDDSPFDFPGISGLYFTVHNERGSRRIKNYVGLTRTANKIVWNASEADMTFSVTGKYWYELGFVKSGGYEIVLQYGELTVI